MRCLRISARAYPYRDLTREEYGRILDMLSLGIAAKRGRYGAYVFRDQVNRRLRARRGARLAAITSGGAIPETALYSVVAQPDEIVVGTLDEDFAVESNAGDIMLLGNTSWRIARVESNSGRVLVEDAHGAPPSIPFWRGEAPGRTAELSHHVGDLREKLSAMLPNTAPLAVPRVAFEQDPPVKDCGSSGLQPGEICDSTSDFRSAEQRPISSPKGTSVPESSAKAQVPPARHRLLRRGRKRRRVAEGQNAGSTMPAPSNWSSTSSPAARCWAKCPPSRRSLPSASSTKAAACS